MSRPPASTSEFRNLALLVLQWPLAAAMLTLVESGISTLPVLAIVLALLSMAALLGPLPGLARMWIAAGLACSAHTVAFGSTHGSLLLALITATLSLQFLMFLAARRMQPAALAFGLLIVAGLAFSYEGWLRYRQTTHVAPYVVTAETTPRARSEVCKTSDGSIEFDVVYTWDEDASRVVPDRPASGPIWTIAGGSYAFGVGVEDHETVVARLQAAFPSKRFHDDAVVAFGTAEVYEKIRDKSLGRDGTELVVYLMIQDHFRRTAVPTEVIRTWGRDKPRYQLAGGKLQLLGTAYESLGPLGQLNIDLMNSGKLYRKITQGLIGWTMDSSILDLTRALLVEAKAESDARGADFLLVLVPQLTEPRPLVDLSQWRRELEVAGVPSIDLRERFDTYLEGRGEANEDYYFVDNHPRPNWHALMAEWLEPQLHEIASGIAHGIADGIAPKLDDTAAANTTGADWAHPQP